MYLDAVFSYHVYLPQGEEGYMLPSNYVDTQLIYFFLKPSIGSSRMAGVIITY